jgi:hypothetical protein
MYHIKQNNLLPHNCYRGSHLSVSMYSGPRYHLWGEDFFLIITSLIFVINMFIIIILNIINIIITIIITIIILVEIQQDCDRSLQISMSSLKAIQTPYSIILIEKKYNPTFLRTSTNEEGDFQPTTRLKMRV